MKPRKDGLFQKQLTLDGKRHTFYGKTRKEANEKAAEARRQHEAGQRAWAEKQTVKEYLEGWLAGQGLTIKATTLQRYTTAIHAHFIPQFGHLPLAKLDARAIQAYYARKLKEGRSSGTIRFWHAVLHHALEDALRYGLVTRNVAEQVKRPREERREMQTLSEEQARTYLQHLEGERLYALFVLALTTGMRQGELRALRWQDVHLERGLLSVQHTIQDLPGGAKIDTAKTKDSRRSIALGKLALDALKARRLAYNKEKLAAGHYWQDTNLVFSDALGEILYRQPLERLHKATLKACGLPAIRFHDLRHTAATLAIARGVPMKMVSEMLGHKNITITLNTYAHVTPTMQQQAAAVMDAIFG